MESELCKDETKYINLNFSNVEQKVQQIPPSEAMCSE